MRNGDARSPRNEWAAAITDAARLEAIDYPALLIPGEKIAWAECELGNTDGFSYVHRVRDGLSTYCGQGIPSPIKRCPHDLTRMLRKECRLCVVEMVKAA